MRSFLAVALATGVVAVPGSPSEAAETPLTLEAALGLARERAPSVIAARGRVAEARARLGTAGLLKENPSVSAFSGRRRADGLRSNDFEVEVGQAFELGGRRNARVAGAEAALAQEIATAAEATRQALRETADAYLRAVHAGDRVRLHEATAAYGRELLAIAERRNAAGDVAALDVNLARSVLARSISELRATEATRLSVLAELRVLLGVEETERPALSHDLGSPPGPPAEDLVGAPDPRERPEIAALESELREAEAELRLGRAHRWPDIAPALRYEREESAHVLWAGATISLPLFNRGQDLAGPAKARADRLRQELEARRRSIRIEVDAAVASHRLRVQAAQELAEAQATFDDNETLSRRSYDVGQIGLAELLAVRRETLEERAALLDRRLEAARSAVELRAAVGALR